MHVFAILSLFLQELGSGKIQRQSIAMTKASTKAATPRGTGWGGASQIIVVECSDIGERNMTASLVCRAANWSHIGSIWVVPESRDQAPASVLSGTALGSILG